MSINKIIIATLLLILGIMFFSTGNSFASGECSSNGGSCVAPYATCATNMSAYNSACVTAYGEGYKCCNLTASENTCTSNNGQCVSSETNCTSSLSSYNSACASAYGSGYKCCAQTGSGTGGSSGTSSLSGIEIPSNTGLPNPGGTNPVITVILTTLQWLMTIFVILAFIAFIITGIQFLVALGNSYSTAASNAKNNFQYAIIALVVVGASYIIVLTINMLLSGGSAFTFSF